MTSSFASNQSNKQTRLRSQEAPHYFVRPKFKITKQGIFKTIDIERSMEGRCRTSLFLFSNKWLIGQGSVYLPLFEGVCGSQKSHLFDRFEGYSMESHGN